MTEKAQQDSIQIQFLADKNEKLNQRNLSLINDVKQLIDQI